MMPLDEACVRIKEFIIKNSYVPSDVCGDIRIRETFYSYEITRKGGYFQSGPFMNRLWRNALKKIPKHTPVHRVLVCGLGAGGVIHVLKKRFPKSIITAIEYDSAMIEVAKRTYLKNPNDIPEIYKGDAYDVIKKLEKKFDLIIIDLFDGKDKNPTIQDENFTMHISRLLAYDGYVLMNFYKGIEKNESAFLNYMFRWKRMRFEGSKIGIYRNFNSGGIGNRLPEGYKNKEQSEYWLRANTSSKEKKTIGKENARGYRRRGILFSEEYFFCDDEPLITHEDTPKVVLWQPLTRTDIKKIPGWHCRWWFERPKQNAIGEVWNDMYFKNWSDHAMRHRKKWLSDSLHEIVETDFETFWNVYKKAHALDWIIKFGSFQVLRYHIRTNEKNVTCFLAREKESKKPIGGLFTVDYPDIALSTHMASFIEKNKRKTSVGVGLIDAWYKHSLARGIHFQNFGILWKKGDPSSWKGYSRFKKNFHPFCLQFPRPYFKIIWK